MLEHWPEDIRKLVKPQDAISCQHYLEYPDINGLIGAAEDRPVLVIGNGPSAEFLPQECYDRYVTIGTNLIHKIRNIDYLVISESIYHMPWSEDTKYEIAGLDAVKVFYDRHDNYKYMPDYMYVSKQVSNFAKPTSGKNKLWLGGSCLGAAIHLARLLTDKEIYVLGADGFVPGYPVHFYDTEPCKETVFGDMDSEGYVYMKWHMALLETAYKSNIKLVNLSPISVYHWPESCHDAPHEQCQPVGQR